MNGSEDSWPGVGNCDLATGAPRPSLLVLLFEITDEFDEEGEEAAAVADCCCQGDGSDVADLGRTRRPFIRYCAPFYTKRLLIDGCPDSEASEGVTNRPEAAQTPLVAPDCWGERVPREIRIATVAPQTLSQLAGMAEQSNPSEEAAAGTSGSASTEPKPSSALSASRAGDTMEKAFFSGNPSAGLTHGLLHLLKDTGDWGADRPSMLAMLAVPAHMTVIDLAQFVAGYSEDLLEMKVIRDCTPGQFMVLLQFTEQAAADRFYSARHGEPFSSLEPDVVCCLAYVARIDTVAPGARFPVRDLVELPTCPVCLDRLDEPLRGILTILCNHSFHLRCLDKWNEASCPVCRFVQTPQPSDGNRCSRCGDTDSLWICLICGYVGCGRYKGGHAYEHFSSTSHTFAMEVGTDRVWDYCGDNFVHRLVQNKADGKLVQVGGEVPDDKLDAVTLEYTYLLTSQLESQRLYYEEQLERQAEAAREAALQAAGLEEARRERAALEKRLGQATTRLQRLQKELEEERGFNASMSSNQRELQDQLLAEQARHQAAMRKKDEELEQLREEMRDLYAHLEAGQRLAGQLTQDEAAASHLVLGEQPQGAAGGGGKTGKRRSGRK